MSSLKIKEHWYEVKINISLALVILTSNSIRSSATTVTSARVILYSVWEKLKLGKRKIRSIRKENNFVLTILVDIELTTLFTKILKDVCLFTKSPFVNISFVLLKLIFETFRI